MGKTKIATIDDSLKEVEKKKPKKPSKKLKKATEVKSGEDSRLSEPGEGEQSAQAMTSTTLPEPIPSEVEGGELENRVQTNEGAKTKKSQKPGKAKPRSKKYQQVTKDLDRSKIYSIPEAVDMAKKMSYSKFNETLEVHINTHAIGIRGLVSLPFASGKKLRILAFGPLPESSEYEGLIFGDDSTIEEINKGKVEFDLVITTPSWMPKLAKVARILGPRGLMPNPKNGTITEDLKKAVESFQAGKTEYKTEPKAPVMHLPLGKLDQPTEELSANVKTLLQTLGKTKIKKVTLSPTMGPSVKVDLASV